ncbi:mevalonate kinase-like [Anoplolepis gracilipes]|uniref:mevalonate kinase-like n=1 Tax=Anoplolepis gracilipes TaxID=354296 RepID=UPI003BA0E9ED
MNAFTISAPGKITLCGEYGEMYGKKVVAASIDLRTTLKFDEISSLTDIEIEFPDVDISLIVPLEKIQNLTTSKNYNYLVENYILFIKHVQYFITINGWWKTFSQRFTLQTFFFLLMYIAHHEQFVIRPFRVHVTTDLIMNTSLGSSTSFAVCLAACFVRWARLQRDDHTKFTQLELQNISKFAMFSEEVIRDFIFNRDRDVCVHGHAVSFRYREHLDNDTEILSAQEMDVLLVDSNIRQNKLDYVTKMYFGKMATERHLSSNFMDNFLNMFDFFNITNIFNIIVNLNIIDDISQKVASALSEIENGHRDNNLPLVESSYKVLQRNIELNQNVLWKLNLSHTKFDTICKIAKRHGFTGKMTGIGAAYVLILLPPNIPKEIIDNLTSDLSKQGFASKKTKICGSGLRIEQE